MATPTASDNGTAPTEQPPVTATVVPDQSSQPPTSSAAAPPPSAEKRWPGWPGDSVFRIIVPVLKVGSIIGRKGDIIKKMTEETRARIRVLDGAAGTPDRIVLVSGQEEPDAPISPAMDAVIRISKRINGLSKSDGGGAVGSASCSIRLLVASTQAISLIGKKGSVIKSIQESSGATVRVLTGDELPFYASPEERIVELQGESLKVLKALELTVGHLRKFLVDHTVLPLFEKTYNATIAQDRGVDTWADKTLLHTVPQIGIGADYTLPVKRDPFYMDRETQLESQIPHTGVSLYGKDPGFSGLRSSGLARATVPIVTQVTQTMQIPLSYAEDIIGIGGANIAYIRRTSGAVLTVQESRGLPDEITVEIKGTSQQVQTAQRLIQDFMSTHKESAPSSYGNMSSYLQTQTGASSYPSSSFPSQPYGGAYGSSSAYTSFRL